ncbi:Mbov_0401 family ICE element transposase-like protein [[Mycoplasma] imitans]|uniref:Mbov_0401 family ICE element transposase-like protein n=1 Tax=[Mycoplasma] imitans TaxID=29560 RepID=UPI00048421C8|nr:UPF0236 family protein [[Mycoplasma] imitans]
MNKLKNVNKKCVKFKYPDVKKSDGILDDQKLNYLTDSFNNFHNQINEFLVKKLKEDYEQLDQKLYKDLRLDKSKNHVVVKDLRTRKLISQFGVIFIKRRRYFDKLKKCYLYLLDEEIKLTKFKCYLNSFLEAIKKEILSNNFVIEKIRKQFFHQVSRTQFIRLLDQIIDKIQQEKIKKSKLVKSKNLYINVDDSFVKVRRKNKVVKTRLRSFLFHQGKDKNNNLINARYFVSLCDPVPLDINLRVKKNSLQLKNIVEKFYKNKAKKLVLCSDGDKQFSALAKHLNIYQSLDKWHLFYSYLFKIINPLKREYDGINKNTRIKLYRTLKYICVNHPRKLIPEIKKLRKILINTHPGSEIASGFLRLISYIKNNFDGILFWKSRDYYPTITEPYIFHKIKKMLGDKNKSFSLKTLLSFILIKQNEYNNRL